MCVSVFKSWGKDGGAGASTIGKENQKHCPGINKEREIGLAVIERKRRGEWVKESGVTMR